MKRKLKNIEEFQKIIMMSMGIDPNLAETGSDMLMGEAAGGIIGSGVSAFRCFKSGDFFIAASGGGDGASRLIKPNQIYHFATNKSKKYTQQLENVANKYGLDLDDEWNKGLMPHQGRHPYAYHDYVLDQMNKFDSIAKGDKSKFLKLYNQMRKKIMDNPDMLTKDYWNK